MNGQEQEKQEISRIKEMANQISQMCDSLMERENIEDKEKGMEGEEGETSIAQKAERIKNSYFRK